MDDGQYEVELGKKGRCQSMYGHLVPHFPESSLLQLNPQIKSSQENLKMKSKNLSSASFGVESQTCPDQTTTRQ